MYLARSSVSRIHGIEQCILHASLILLLSLSGCFDDVVRDNPLDPLSERYNPVGALSGTVTNRARSTVGNVFISITPVSGFGGSSYRAATDGQGRFVFDTVPGGTYAIEAEGEGYVSFQDTVTVAESGATQKDIVLNGVPFIGQASARSGHFRRVWPPPREFFVLEFDAVVGDLDGALDIESIWVDIPGLSVRDTLTFTGTQGQYASVIAEEDLAGVRVHDVIGEQIQFFVRDRLGAVVSAAPLQVARIIMETPVVITPQAGTVETAPQPVLVWVCEDIPFEYTFRIEVVRTDDFVRNTITRIEAIPPESVCDERREAQFQVNVALEEGEYFWTVSIIDSQGNSSRSIEAGFAVRLDQ